MPSWILPGLAAAFMLGALAAPESSGRGEGAAMAALGGMLVTAATLAIGARGRGPSPLLRAAGLIEEGPTRDYRERILAAAGMRPSAPNGRGASRHTEAPRAAAIRAAVVLLVGAMLFGAGWWVLRRARPDVLAPLSGSFVELSGAAASDVRTFDFGWGLEVELETVSVRAERVALDARAWVSGSGPPPPLEAGERIAASGALRSLVSTATGFEAHLVSRGVVATVSSADIEVVAPPSNPLLRLANGARAAFRRGVEAALPPREAGLLLGLAIGDTSRMEPEIERDFRATGLGHLVAVSGANVALFLVPVLGVSVLVGTSGRSRFAVGVVAVAFFALVTRWEPSVLRASAMAIVAMGGILAGRPRATVPLLSAAVIGVLLVDPALARSVGFQLSVAATAGLAALASPIAARLVFLPRPLALALAATLAAQLGVTPLLLLDFGVVPMVTILANVLAAPVVAPALLLGLVSSAAALVWSPLGEAAGRPATFLVGLLVEIADSLARAPLPSLTATGVAVPLTVAGLAALVVWRLRRGRRRVGTAIATVAIAATAWSSIPRAGPPAQLTVVFLDVGQGDAAVVRTPDGATMLVDAGPDEDAVATKLAAMGVRRIDVAVASHAHADHIEGFATVLSRFPVGVLLEPGCSADSPSYARLLEAIEEEDIDVRHPRGGARLRAGGLVLDVLGPDACSPGGAEPNDESLVLRISWRDAVVLFPGDAEVPAQRDLLEDGDPLEADVLKVPHHGGDTSLEEFFAAVGGDVAVVSTGPNDYGHPVRSVLDVLASTGARVFRTDLAGDVTVRIADDTVLVESAS